MMFIWLLMLAEYVGLYPVSAGYNGWLFWISCVAMLSMLVGFAA
jgi:hypothetical protein